MENEGVGVRFDFDIDDDGDLRTDDFFDTSLIVSLFTDARANASEVVEPQLRRGWIGNEFTPGFEMGSKLWLFHQARLTTDTTNRMVTVTQESLQWLIDQNYAIEVETEVAFDTQRVLLDVTITRPSSKVDKRLFELWDNSGVTTRTPL